MAKSVRVKQVVWLTTALVPLSCGVRFFCASAVQACLLVLEWHLSLVLFLSLCFPLEEDGCSRLGIYTQYCYLCPKCYTVTACLHVLDGSGGASVGAAQGACLQGQLPFKRTAVVHAGVICGGRHSLSVCVTRCACVPLGVALRAMPISGVCFECGNGTHCRNRRICMLAVRAVLERSF